MLETEVAIPEEFWIARNGHHALYRRVFFDEGAVE